MVEVVDTSGDEETVVDQYVKNSRKIALDLAETKAKQEKIRARVWKEIGTILK